MKKRLKNKNGITLIVLVVTIIVLLILIGITLSMIASQHGIINKAIEARSKTKKANIQEELDLATLEKLYEIENNENNENNLLDDVVKKVEERGTEIKTITDSNSSISKIELSKTSVSLKQNESEVISVIIEKTTESKRYYAVIENKYYEIIEENGKIKLSDDESKINNNEENTTLAIEVTGNNNTTITVNQENKEITIEGTNIGKDSLVVKYGGKEATCDVEVTSAEPVTHKLNIDVTFPNKIYSQPMDYTSMTVTVGYMDKNNKWTQKEMKLGNDSPDFTYLDANESGNGYVTYRLNNAIDIAEGTSNVVFRGLGYRRFTAIFKATQDTDLTVWNNAMSNEKQIINWDTEKKYNVTFLAGEMIGDNIIDIHDTSLINSWYTSTKPEVGSIAHKCDVNRDGKVDSMDYSIAMVSWGK